MNTLYDIQGEYLTLLSYADEHTGKHPGRA